MADVEVGYKGATIGALNNTGSLTLETAGTYVEDDITVDYTKSGGGGGAGNFVKGTFTTGSTGGWEEISVPYTGNGYPVSILVYPSAGAWDPNSGMYSLLSRYAVVYFLCVKSVRAAVPSYSGSANDQFATMTRYKNSSSDASSLTQTATQNTAVLRSENGASNYAYNQLRMPSAAKLLIHTKESMYGFAPGTEYTYEIAYSS